MLHDSSLHAHPTGLCPAVIALHVSTIAFADGGVRLRFQLEAELNALLIPAIEVHAGFTDNLWEHTCFEAFIGTAATPAYREFNFSPSGQWAAYAFTDYRQRDTIWQPGAAPTIHRRDVAEGLDLEVTVPASLLPINTNSPPVTLHIGLNAVIETSGGTLSYWALTHPGEHPDFHQRAGFTLRLEPHTDLP